MEPLPASRPRVTRWGTYIAKPYKEWLAAASKYLKTTDARIPHGRHLAVVVEVVCTRARTSKLSTPKGDIDNYVKAPLDAITHAGLWQDDKWVTSLVASKRFAAADEAAHTAVTVFVLPAKGGVLARIKGFLSRVLD